MRQLLRCAACPWPISLEYDSVRAQGPGVGGVRQRCSLPQNSYRAFLALLMAFESCLVGHSPSLYITTPAIITSS